MAIIVNMHKIVCTVKHVQQKKTTTYYVMAVIAF